MLKAATIVSFVGLTAFSTTRADVLPSLLETIQKTYSIELIRDFATLKTPIWFLNYKFYYTAEGAKISSKGVRLDCSTVKKVSWPANKKDVNLVLGDINRNILKTYIKYGKKYLVLSTTYQDDLYPELVIGYFYSETEMAKVHPMFAKFYVEVKGTDASIYLCEAQKRQLSRIKPCLNL